MKRNTKLLVGTGVFVGLIGSTPLVTHAASASDYITGATQSIFRMSNGVEAIINPNKDSQRAKFYESTVKSLDHNASNHLYKVTKDGYTFWSPIRPKNAGDGGVSNGEYIYENLYTAQMYDRGGVDPSRWLGNLWLANKNISRNFKTVQAIPKMDAYATTKKGMKKLGVYVEKSPDYNNGGNFKNQSGSWRFAGYSSDGSSLQYALFPGDYVAPSVTDLDWNKYSQYGDRLFNQTRYDDGDYASAKKNLIQRLLQQYPIMKYKSVNQWMSILSLQTEPELNPSNDKPDGRYGGAVFAAYHTNGTKYRTFTLYADSNQGDMNLNLSKLTLAENTKISGTNSYPIVGQVARSKAETRDTYKPSIPSNQKTSGKVVAGKTYRIEATVENMSKVTTTKHSPTTVDVGLAKNYSSSLEPSGQYDKDYDDVSTKATHSGKIAKGGSVITVGTITVPSNAKPGSTIRLGGIIDDAHRIAGDNLNYTDDDLMLTAKVATGNITATQVTLVDENGKEVSEPLPGHQYKMRYKFKYSGPTLQDATKVTINYQNTRKLPDGNQEAILYKNGSKTSRDTSASKSIQLVNGKSYSIDSQSYQWYEIPWIKTAASLSSSVPGLNDNNEDDSYSKTWDEQYNYSIENLQVVARTERDGVATDGKQHFGVSFTVDSDMPQAAAKDNYAKDVNIRINLGGKTKIITQHITPGQNKDIVVDMAMDSPVEAGSILNAKVDVNYDSRAYENGPGQSDNSATTRVDSSKIQRDAKTGALINPSNSTTNTGSVIDKPVDPNKETIGTADNNQNSWNQKYHVESWNGKKITYVGMNGSKTYSFYRYTPTSNYTQNVSQNESYKITDVLMKSKVTTDNKWGNNGWVSMLNDPGHAQVKAGYGYQLKMTVEYNTNAFSTEPSSAINSNGSGTSVRPQNVLPNIPKDVYFQTSDGKILSATGTQGTSKTFVPRVVQQTKEKLVVEYTLANTSTLGISTPGRIYISENTPNGMYSVRAWTPTINGVPTKNKTTDSLGFTLYKPENMLDIQGGTVSNEPKALPTSGKDSDGNSIIDLNSVPNMNILVVGSDKDDLVNSVVQ